MAACGQLLLLLLSSFYSPCIDAFGLDLDDLEGMYDEHDGGSGGGLRVHQADSATRRQWGETLANGDLRARPLARRSLQNNGRFGHSDPLGAGYSDELIARTLARPAIWLGDGRADFSAYCDDEVSPGSAYFFDGRGIRLACYARAWSHHAAC